MTDIAKPKRGRKIDLECLRCLRCGDLLKLYRHRWGTLLPDDDSGRADLFEILCVTSLALKAPKEKMLCTIEVLAPWLSQSEANDTIDHIQSIPIFERTRTARHLGNNMRLLNAEREALHLWRLLPVDMTDEQLAEQRKLKSRKRGEAKRRQSGVRTRAEYLAELRAKPKPWEGSGLSRAQWYRRKRDGVCPIMRRGSDATIVFKAATHLVSSELAESQRRGQQGSGDAKMLREAREVGEVERQEQRGSHEHGTHPVSHEVDERIAALGNWGKNAEQKKSTVSSEPKKPGPDRCSAKSCVISRSFRWRQMNSLSRRHHEQRDLFSCRSLRPTRSLVEWRPRFQNRRGFKTKDALQASLSPADRKCIAVWECRRFGAPLTCVDVPPPQRRDVKDRPHERAPPLRLPWQASSYRP
jgi:hypothetical protein